MKKMKFLATLMVCSVLLAAVLSGCSKAPSITDAAEPEKTAEKETADESKQEKEEAEEVSESKQKAEEPAESVQEIGEPAESVQEISEPEESVTDKILAVYREILEAAPAIAGEHPELMDASLSYEQNLELFGNHYDLFAIYDVNQDSVPELIVLSTINFRWTLVSVYTYADGEAVLLKDPAYPDVPGSLDQRSTANGAYTTYFCEDNHIHSVWRGMTPMGEAEENHAYEVKRAALAAVDCSMDESENTVSFYDVAKENTAENVNEMFP